MNETLGMLSRHREMEFPDVGHKCQTGNLKTQALKPRSNMVKHQTDSQHYQNSAAAAAAAAKLLQSCPTLCDPIDGSPLGSPRPWDSPGKNAGVGCHFLLQCRKVKSESEVSQSGPTLQHSMDCSLPGSSVHGIFQAKVLEWGAIATFY